MQRLRFAPVGGCHRIRSEVIFGGIDARRQGEPVFGLVRRLGDMDGSVGKSMLKRSSNARYWLHSCAWPGSAANASASVAPANVVRS